MEKQLRGEDWLLRHGIVPQSKVLELGCGEGYDSAYLLDKGHIVTSTDLSQICLDKTRKTVGENVNSKIMTLDLTNKKDWEHFADNSFDVVVASLCLHYFGSQQTKQILQEIKRVLKPAGKLLARINSNKDILHGSNEGEIIDGDPHFRQATLGPKRFFDNNDIKSFFGAFGTINSAIERKEKYGYKQTEKVLWEISATSDKRN